MLFAAGYGTRMKHLTKDRPKPLIPVAGRALIDHALDLTQAISPRRIVANLHYKAELLEQHLNPLGVTTVIETPDILDTGGGLRNALEKLGQSPVFSLNSDAIWSGPNPLAALKNAWNPDVMDALLMCVPIEAALAYEADGDFSMDEDGKLTRGRGYVYGGAQIIKTDLLETVSDQVFSLNAIWSMMEQKGTLYGLGYGGQWCDVGHPEGVAIAEAMIGTRDV